MKVDLHVHTIHSPDSLTPCADVLRWADRRGIERLAITDHDTVAGALILSELAPERIIVGEEIRTSQGEIIGLFLEREIAPGLTPAETARRIHEQGGLVYVPHPTDRARLSSALAPQALAAISDQVDLIEVLNARVTFALDNRAAEELAYQYGLLRGAGSDAHQGYEIGSAYVETPPFADAASLKSALAQGQIGGHLSFPLVHMGSTYAKLAKGLLAIGLLGRG